MIEVSGVEHRYNLDCVVMSGKARLLMRARGDAARETQRVVSIRANSNRPAHCGRGYPRSFGEVMSLSHYSRRTSMKQVVVIAFAIVCGTASAALADSGWDPNLDELIIINSGMPFSIEDGQSQTFEVFIEPNQNRVIGFSFAGVWQGGGGAWASDTRLNITAPDGTSIFRGGFPAPGGDNDWDFQGGQSAPDGVYSHGQGSPFGDGDPDFAFNKISKGGVWIFEFEQTWGVADWKGVVIVLHKQVPAPGAFALLTLAGGMLGSRRRRS
jgi:hypothetical protein